MNAAGWPAGIRKGKRPAASGGCRTRWHAVAVLKNPGRSGHAQLSRLRQQRSVITCGASRDEQAQRSDGCNRLQGSNLNPYDAATRSSTKQTRVRAAPSESAPPHTQHVGHPLGIWPHLLSNPDLPSPTVISTGFRSLCMGLFFEKLRVGSGTGKAGWLPVRQLEALRE